MKVKLVQGSGSARVDVEYKKSLSESFGLNHCMPIYATSQQTHVVQTMMKTTCVGWKKKKTCVGW